jgi:SAM-dependent methyltransferase
MNMIHRPRRYESSAGDGASKTIATIYNRAGSAYVAYADGNPGRLFDFESPHAYADRCLWSILESKLTALHDKGARSLRILDAGCGPGTWLRRLVSRARTLGFTSIVARGFDVAETQVRAARRLACDLSELPGVDMTFDVADLTAPLPEADGTVDLTLCLYSVLSHLPLESVQQVSAELARVTGGHFVTTVRSIGSTPSIFVDSIEKARRFQHDHERDLCRIELYDGRRFTLRFHLFTVEELKRCFADHFAIEDICGLDLFHSRFVPDPRWNPPSQSIDQPCRHHLAQLEEAYARMPGFMEQANHLMLVGRPSVERGGKPMSDSAPFLRRPAARKGRAYSVQTILSKSPERRAVSGD